MGKKGVMLDNGKNAQSSMALYWRKNREQQNQPKKKYEPTQEQQLQQRVETGFQKWKLHKEKMISKAYEKKQKKQQGVGDKKQESQEEQVQIKKPQGPIKIPGFKSKDQLQRKLHSEKIKQVNQKDNVLQLPSNMQGLTQDDIIQILREKKAKKQMQKRKKNIANAEEDVMLGQDFLSSFKTEPEKKKQQEERLKKEQEERIAAEKLKQEEEKHFFKSDILNQISQGNHGVLLQPKQIEKPAIEVTQQKTPQFKKEEEPEGKPQKLLFKPRVLDHKK